MTDSEVEALGAEVETCIKALSDSTKGTLCEIELHKGLDVKRIPELSRCVLLHLGVLHSDEHEGRPIAEFSSGNPQAVLSFLHLEEATSLGELAQDIAQNCQVTEVDLFEAVRGKYTYILRR